jgi:hypothetical protein
LLCAACALLLLALLLLLTQLLPLTLLPLPSLTLLLYRLSGLMMMVQQVTHRHQRQAGALVLALREVVLVVEVVLAEADK